MLGTVLNRRTLHDSGRLAVAPAATGADQALLDTRIHDLASGGFRRLPWWLVDLVLAALVLSAAFLPFRDLAPAALSNPFGVVLFVIAAAFVPARRRCAQWVLAANLVLFAVAAVTHSLTPGFSVPLAIAIYAVAVVSERRMTLIAAALAAALATAFSFVAYPISLLDPRILQLLSFVAFAAAIGDAVKSRRAYMRQVAERAVNAEHTREVEARRRVAEERLRIARDLHDSVAHQIAVINLHAGVASAALPQRPADAEESLATIRTAARSVLQEIGDLLGLLRSAAATEPVQQDEADPFPPGQRASLDRLAELLDQYADTGLRVSFTASGEPVELPGLVDIVGYRVIQEALTNAHKHGLNNTAALDLRYRATSIDIRISNPTRRAKPPQPNAATGGFGNGLPGLRERVTSVRGTVLVDESDPARFVLEVSLPIGVRSAGEAGELRP